MHVSDAGLGEPASLGGLLVAARQAADAVSLQAAVQGVAGECGDALTQAAENIIEWQKRPASELNDDRLLQLCEYGDTRPARAHGQMRRRHLATDFGFRPYRAARMRVVSFDAWSSALTRGVCGLNYEGLVP